MENVFKVKFLVDLGTPKEVLFNTVIAEELMLRGHDVIFTTRKYRETNDLINHFNIPAKIVGKHGTTLETKFDYGIERILKLRKYLKKQGKIDGLISLCNPECCKLAFGLGIQIYNFIDVPEANKVCKLTLPLSTVVFTPFHVSDDQISKFWSGERFVYDCLDPVAWMSGMIPSERLLLDDLGTDVKYPFVIYRRGETRATYYQDLHKPDITDMIVTELKKQYPDGLFYEVSRYNGHRMVNLQNMLYFADLFIGGGGTINIESAYWGTWTMSCRPFSTTYDDWLNVTGNQYHVSSVSEGVETANMLLDKIDKNPESEAIQTMEFPVIDIVNRIVEG